MGGQLGFGLSSAGEQFSGISIVRDLWSVSFQGVPKFNVDFSEDLPPAVTAESSKRVETNAQTRQRSMKRKSGREERPCNGGLQTWSVKFLLPP